LITKARRKTWLCIKI